MKRLLLFTATALALVVPAIAGAQDSGQYPRDDGSYAQDAGPGGQDNDPNARDDGPDAQNDDPYSQDNGPNDPGPEQDGDDDGQYGYATGDVNLRAGPDSDYPSVSTIPEGAELQIDGCTEGWEWCDVSAANGEDRGWVAGNYIEYDYQDRPVLLSEYGARVGVPIVSFSIGNYWDRYYRNRPFYGDRARWYARPYYHHPAPRPFVGWSLRFAINGRDHHDWHHHDHWERNRFDSRGREHGRDQRDDRDWNHRDSGNDHGWNRDDHGGDRNNHDKGNDHHHDHTAQVSAQVRVDTAQHGPKDHSSHAKGGNEPVIKAGQNVVPNGPRPQHTDGPKVSSPHDNTAPNGDHKAHSDHNAKPGDKKKDDKDNDHQH